MQPETRYARSGEINIGYQVVGDGSLDLVFIPGFVSHIDAYWADPAIGPLLERLASFSRLILFDKRGMGTSDPVSRPATLDERADDIRAVMEAAGSERAAILGFSEGAPMGVLFAATYPQRTAALILAGGLVSGRDPEGNPGGPRWVKAMERMLEQVEHWGDGSCLELLLPSMSDDRGRRLLAMFERVAASPAMAKALLEMNLMIDVSDLLPAVRVPTLVLHRRDEFVPVENAYYMAEHIPDAKLVVLDGEDHVPWLGDSESYIGEIEEFLTGARHVHEPDRALATVLFTDIVDSTRLAAELGDAGWRQRLSEHDRAVRAALERFRGTELKSLGDGFLATFDGPARAVRCAQAIVDRVRDQGLEVRAGLHTGECELLSGDVRGMAVNIAARVAALAGPGEVLVSSTVRDLVVGSGLAFAERGEFDLKGVPGRWRLFAAGDGAALPALPAELELRAADRALLVTARRAPRLARAAVARYRRGARR